MRLSRLILVAPGLLALACLSPSTSPPPEDPSILARFQGGEVSVAELEAFPLQSPPDAGPADASADTTGDQDAADEDKTPDGDPRLQLLTAIAVDKALDAEAAAWTEPSLVSRVDAAVEQATAGLLQQAMMERRGWIQPEVSEEELKAYFEDHPEFYDEPRRARLQHIFFRAEKGVMPPVERREIRQRLEGIYKETTEGADFTALAKRHSESATAASGGFMSLDANTQVPPAFAAAVWSLKANEISDVVDAGNGFHLIKLVQISEPKRRTFEESLDHIRRKATQAKLKDLQLQLIRDLGPRYGLEQHYDRLHSDPDASESAVLIKTDNEDPYTLKNLLDELHEALQEQLFQGYTADVHRFLDQVAAKRLLLLEARDLKLAEDPEIAPRIAESARRLRVQAALQRRLELAVMAEPESELREYFEQYEDRYQTLRTYDLTVIHLQPESGDSFWQLVKRGEELAARIRSGEDMESLARKHSRHYTASAGGRMHYMTEFGIRSRIQANVKFRRQLEALTPGGVSDPILSECYDPPRLSYVRTGVYIVRLDALHEPVPKTFEEMTEAVRQNYLRRYHRRIVSEVRQQVAEEINLEIFAERLPTS